MAVAGVGVQGNDFRDVRPSNCHVILSQRYYDVRYRSQRKIRYTANSALLFLRLKASLYSL
jgi:hypothetical protein